MSRNTKTIGREIRALPRDRRRALIRAIREGQAVDDPRDAALAVEWAQRMQQARWPWWLLPANRPHGTRAALWGVHTAWVAAVVVIGVIGATWHHGEIIRWTAIGILLYSALSMPWFFRMILRARWNAPDAERLNRELLAPHDGRA